MIKKLRRKFVFILMSMVTVILLAVFFSVLYSTRSNVASSSYNLLWQVAKDTTREGARQSPNALDNPGEDRRNDGPRGEPRTPTLIVWVDKNGEYEIVKNHIHFLEDSDIAGIVQSAAAQENQQGILNDYTLRYVKYETSNGTRIALADTSMETMMLRDLMKESLLVGAGALVLFLLLSTMLRLARSDNAESSLVLSSVDFSDVVDSRVLLFEPAIFESGKELEADIAEGVHVRGDQTLLWQAVDILLDNAQKYSPPGGKITLRLSENAQKQVLLKVRNPGESIPREELTSIFQRFYRIDQSRQNHGGFGLGLSILQSIASQHKGKVWAESDSSGNTFYLQLPVET